MRKVNLIIFIMLLTLILITGCTSKKTAEHSQVESEYYTCPMHPTIVQDEEGDCPICGMDLVVGKSKNAEVQETNLGQYYTCGMHPEIVLEEAGNCPVCHMDLVLRETSSQSRGDVYNTDNKSITIDPAIVQNMGVRVKHVSFKDISHNIRTIGKVEIADDKNYVVNLRFSGWVEQMFADKVGQKIVKGTKLFEIYSPELITAQEEYLLGVNTYGKDSKITKSSAKRLRLWNIPKTHLDKILSENNAQQNVIITSPFSGHILHKNIKEGSKIKAGTDLYHIGNLDKIW
ncbi:MAG: hypothetical protein HOB92_05940, partial [Candidatus Cloacimonetes bacterium]|nr:hypothetical protein [Candidatus Cloacimonadota bacterium]